MSPDKNREKANAYQRKYTKDHPGFRSKVVLQWMKRNPLKHLAHQQVAQALREGTLKRKPCKVCKGKRTDAHHPNYAFPLKVVWYCRLHHKAAHKK